MTKFLDYMISPLPIRVVDLKVDKSKLNIKSLTITEIGHLPGRTLQRNQATFDSWALAYIAGGRGFYKVNGGVQQTVEKGSLFFVFPDATFDYGPEENGNWDEYYIRFEGTRIQEWLQNWLFQTETIKYIGWEEATINKLEMIFLLIESGVPSKVDQAALLLESLIYEWISKSNESHEKATKLHVVQLIHDISNNLYEPIDSEKIAKRNNIAVPTLRRMVSQYTGYPLNEYIHRLKVAETKRLLLNTDMQIKEISEALGYTDECYFSRLFKKYVGMAPKQYRNSN
ncbi:helix-turn-helix domain-containing protein [Paenibacillus sp. LMG 31458]|uniref:Helix-turn-helix domain-containing protein n=1 Tax=Paenibacillus phytorum TaxID=2654977 RepID=A0ABX1Y0E1_9BACL|nr:AraC family transcriptional regulator [Paenibacillus phytorum]NOU73746.1 helix-turn-helix domain-containing protein [Paenibacillus phytorum]